LCTYMSEEDQGKRNGERGGKKTPKRGETLDTQMRKGEKVVKEVGRGARKKKLKVLEYGLKVEGEERKKRRRRSRLRVVQVASEAEGRNKMEKKRRECPSKSRGM